MGDSSFNIYNASAGSGKTYTLAKSYIKILVKAQSYDQFKSILAITFTNKAVGEMKTRIIDMLRQFSSDKSLIEPHSMFVDICQELSIEPTHLKNKSKHILKHIIHNYGAFDISTIDGFTHRIIRTFAHDLNLPVNFEVELDQDRLLNEAVDNLISKAGDDEALTKTLIDFAFEKTDQDKSWDIGYDFNKIAKLLVSENDLEAINVLKTKTLNDFNTLKDNLLSSIISLEKDIGIIASKALTLIEECGLQFDDFNRGSLPKHFKQLKDKNFNLNFEVGWQKDLLNNDTLYPKRVTDSIAETIDSIQPQLITFFESSKRLVFELKLKRGFYNHITPLSVLNSIRKELDTLKEEQNKMLISEFNKIISNEIKNQPTPFIYERLGEKFKHYFVDEFQDTSRLQWENLTPLFDNTLSASNGTAMLVGDAKQAIYRWRGGEAEQFIGLYDKSYNPFQIEPDVISLNSNYRSAKQIIKFNNGFFKFLSQNYFSDDNYANLYENGQQNATRNANGYVNLQFIDITVSDDASLLYCEKVYETIINCLSRGYELNDICILVRKRKEGIAIADYLSQKNLKITSSETLLISNSPKVKLLDTTLRLLVQEDNDSLKIEILSALSELYDIHDKHTFFTSHLESNTDKFFKGLESLNVFINKIELISLSLYDLVEELIRSFKLNEQSDAYIQFYLDFILEFTQKQNADLSSFLKFFDTKKDSLSIISSQNLNAIEIMTIHKSKGLEFPIVIFPFADLNIYKELEPKIWFPAEREKFNDFELLLLNYSKDVVQFGEVGERIFREHQSQLELDNINLLYVALTRPEDELHIISKKDFDSKGNVKDNTYSGMLISYLQSLGKWSDQRLSYNFGESESKQSKAEKEEFTPQALPLLSIPKEDHNLNIITKSGQLWDTKQEKAIERGNKVHLILSKIKYLEDLDFAFNDLISSGEIVDDEKAELKRLVLEVINHPMLQTYYVQGSEVYNERDIITDSGLLFRPDRLNIINSNAIIIDYKTGIPKSSHGSQLDEYSNVISMMGFNVTHKYLVYINDAIKVIEV